MPQQQENYLSYYHQDHIVIELLRESGSVNAVGALNIKTAKNQRVRNCPNWAKKFRPAIFEVSYSF
jgi:hypothetical protein